VRVHDGLLAWNQTLRSPPPPVNTTSAPGPAAAAASAATATTTATATATVTAANESPTSAGATGAAGAAGTRGVEAHSRLYPYTVAEERVRRDAEALLEAEGVCPPNLAQGTSEELSFRFGWNTVLTCGRDSSAVGVVASPVYSPNGGEWTTRLPQRVSTSAAVSPTTAETHCVIASDLYPQTLNPQPSTLNPKPKP